MRIYASFCAKKFALEIALKKIFDLGVDILKMKCIILSVAFEGDGSTRSSRQPAR